jgi:hypothetical protein
MLQRRYGSCGNEKIFLFLPDTRLFRCQPNHTNRATMVLHKEGMFEDMPNKPSPKADRECLTNFSVGYTVKSLTKEHTSKLDGFCKDLRDISEMIIKGELCVIKC